MEQFSRRSALLPLIFFMLVSASAAAAATARDTITPTTPLSDNETLVCASEAFALGFFTPPGTANSYVGLWYNQISEPGSPSILWVANRQNPVVVGSARALLSVTPDGRLTITSSNKSVVWTSPNSTVKLTNAAAQLLDNGNLVVKQEGDNSGASYGWEGFNYLTDTLIPGMRLGLDRTTGINRTLVAWASATDPSPGAQYAFMDVKGAPEIYLYQGSTPIWRTGPWDGTHLSGIPDMSTYTGFAFGFANDASEVTYFYSISNQTLVSRLIVNYTGVVQRALWLSDSNQWNFFWTAPKDSCDDFGYCGPYGLCDSNASPQCSCLPGFVPKNPANWNLRDGSDGCVRKHEMECSMKGSTDGFNTLRNVKLPQSENCTVDLRLDRAQCQELCLQNCLCIAYASANVSNGGSGCVFWAGDRLFDNRNFMAGGQDLNVRVAARDVAASSSCDDFGYCGPNGLCDSAASPPCSCLTDEFSPRIPSNWKQGSWRDGCERNNELDCGWDGSTDGFETVSNVKLMHSGTVNMSLDLPRCRQLCLQNCSCIAYASANVSGGGCVIWVGDGLSDIQNLVDGRLDHYVRVAAVDLGLAPSQSQKMPSQSQKMKITVVITVSLISGMLLLACIGWFIWKKKKKRDAVIYFNEQFRREAEENDVDIHLFDFDTIATATNRFSPENKLGEGGFGPVYKGGLGEYHEVAVKRLAKTSQQGAVEFKNEVMLIAKLQHRNLVRLLGCCIHGEERILIYEYMPNKSLDAFLFVKEKSALLDWNTRYRIIIGITRGLLYLHHDSRFRIIHRDLKAGNILLDKEMNPKISDFGMARIFGGDQTNFNTRKVVGTYGYMSPEYAMEGIFSMKSDVYSFGVLILEIISGRRNRGEYTFSHHLNLVAHAWSLWNEGRSLQIVYESMGNGAFPADEALKCIKVGLLCVQENPEDRPLMSSIVVMLDSASDIASLPQPKQPGFIAYTFLEESRQEPHASNGLTVSMDGR